MKYCSFCHAPIREESNVSDPALNYQLKEIARALGYLVHEFKRFNDNVEAQQVAAITAIRKQKEEEPTSTT